MSKTKNKFPNTPIALADISQYRSELMGAAILFIILFHVPLPREDTFFGLHRCGNIGVDIFLFLSGMGLWFAWVRNPSVKHFYLRRLLRIMPTWLVVAALFYIPRFTPGGSIVDLIGDITLNWGFWQHGELTFWYVPATMMLYLWAPLYMMLISRWPVCRWLPVLAVMWCIAVQWVVPLHQSLGYLEIFWSRIPIFLIGIEFGEAIRKQQQVEPAGRWLSLVIFFSTAALCLYLEQERHGRFPLFAERMVYIPLTISMIILLADAFRHFSAGWRRPLAFLGTLSLEIYLLHCQFVMMKISPYHLGYWPTALLTIALTVPLAWLLQKLLKRILPI
ncbi:MAG: acyltransferase [Prevotella sp.]|nr:acyltransferase [Prevotella sp.]